MDKGICPREWYLAWTNEDFWSSVNFFPHSYTSYKTISYKRITNMYQSCMKRNAARTSALCTHVLNCKLDIQAGHFALHPSLSQDQASTSSPFPDRWVQKWLCSWSRLCMMLYAWRQCLKFDRIQPVFSCWSNIVVLLQCNLKHNLLSRKIKKNIDNKDQQKAHKALYHLRCSL